MDFDKIKFKLSKTVNNDTLSILLLGKSEYINRYNQAFKEHLEKEEIELTIEEQGIMNRALSEAIDEALGILAN